MFSPYLPFSFHRTSLEHFLFFKSLLLRVASSRSNPAENPLSEQSSPLFITLDWSLVFHAWFACVLSPPASKSWFLVACLGIGPFHAAWKSKCGLYELILAKLPMIFNVYIKLRPRFLLPF